MVVGAKVCDLTEDFLWFVCRDFDMSSYDTYVDGGHDDELAAVEADPHLLKGGPEGGEAVQVGLVHLHNVQASTEDAGLILQRRRKTRNIKLCSSLLYSSL